MNGKYPLVFSSEEIEIGWYWMLCRDTSGNNVPWQCVHVGRWLENFPDGELQVLLPWCDHPVSLSVMNEMKSIVELRGPISEPK